MAYGLKASSCDPLKGQWITSFPKIFKNIEIFVTLEVHTYVETSCSVLQLQLIKQKIY